MSAVLVQFVPNSQHIKQRAAKVVVSLLREDSSQLSRRTCNLQLLPRDESTILLIV